VHHRIAFFVGALALGSCIAANANSALSDNVVVCNACHGDNGHSQTPDWPSIGGQSKEYLRAQLVALREGRRYDDTMTPMAKTLSDEDIEALADFYSKQSLPDPRPETAAAAAGKSLFETGRDGVQACSTCHGAKGEGDANFEAPALRGQNAPYTRKQMTMYADATRYRADAMPDSEHVRTMHAVAQQLSKEEIESLAAYIESMR
jgi:cytochrome c553